MRALAARLGVSPNALYNHFRDKTELIDAVLDHVLGGVQATTPRSQPRRLLEEIMMGSYDVLTAHHRLIPLYLERRGARGDNAVALGALMSDALGRLGVDPGRSARIVHVLIVQVIGFTAYGTTAPDSDANRRAFIDSLTWTLDGIVLRDEEEPRRPPHGPREVIGSSPERS